MANVGALTMMVRADTGKLGKDLSKVGGIIDDKLAPKNSLGSFNDFFKTRPIDDFQKRLANLKPINASLVAPIMAQLVDPFKLGARNIDRYGTAFKKLFNNAGARQFAGLADAVGDAGEMFAAFGPLGGGALLAIAAGVGVVVAGMVTLRKVTSQAMSTVAAAFQSGDKSKTLEALRAIIKSGGAAGVKITLVDTQKVQAVNESFAKLGAALTALGVRIVSDFQPVIIGAIESLTNAVRVMSNAANAIGKVVKPAAQAIGSRPGRAIFNQTAQSLGDKLIGSGAGSVLRMFTDTFAGVAGDIAGDPKLARIGNGTGSAGKMANAITSPGAFEAFSAQAASASIQARNAFAGDPADHSKDLASKADKQIEETKQMKNYLAEILRVLVRNNANPVAANLIGI